MKGNVSITFLLMTTALVVCLIASNLFASKIISIFGILLPGAVLIFPLAYILNDCICEVWGYKKARLVIWLAFAMNALLIGMGKLLVWIPGADVWDGAAHFDYMFDFAPRAIFASMLGFWCGSTLNAWVMSLMKKADNGKRFGLRAIVSSVVGESADSLIFFPIVFWGTQWTTLVNMMVAQVCVKIVYEIVILPVTTRVVKLIKRRENVDIYDENISYNPFNVWDI